eukprot:scaffold76759_cov22-Tisochrysis_lutea.AAC.2
MNTTECRERGVARVPFKRALLACLPDCRRHGLAKDAAPEQGETHKGGPTRRGPRRRDPQRREGADLEQGEPMWARSGLLLSQGAVLRPGGGYLGVGAPIGNQAVAVGVSGQGAHALYPKYPIGEKSSWLFEP